MTRPGVTIYPKQAVADIACAAHRAGKSMSAVVAEYFAVTRPTACSLISRARDAGFAIPMQHAKRTPRPDAPAPAAQIGTPPGHSITKAEHDALMAHRDRPLTQQVVQRHRSSGNGHQLGELL